MSEDDDYGDEILFEAAKKNHVTMFDEYYQQRLNKKNWNPNLIDVIGNTALHYSCTFKHLEITKKLLELGANPNIQNKSSGDTPLHKAIWANQIAIAELLIEKNADVTICNNQKQNALMVAKTAEMKALINQALLAKKFSSEDFADDDDDEDENESANKSKKPYKPSPHDHSDMVANDSDDE
ncbi:hypothetical protein DLAC_11189 [Tieghemostelium lacteum]|uniref:Uncharacterized protein n=1 Tax=Tieghemostelium lacteum TaxID=361077 RepID=A0A151Z3D7_TIELA|nr:hypothetical protein DLAC_11189 [Tieghemostelium lacteum]|eukprot:KYQ88476.1 hypothetical protein DLAC_11189 [Tieghemostelium lacteum]